MSQETKYSFNQLHAITQDINEFINNTDQLDRLLLFNLRRNAKKAKEAIELLKDDFEQLSEDEMKEAQKFDQEKIKLIKKYGGETEEQNGQLVLSEDSPNLPDEFWDDLTELKTEYDDVLTKANKITKKNQKLANEPVAEVEFKEIKLEQFPEQLGTYFTDNFLEFVTTA